MPSPQNSETVPLRDLFATLAEQLRQLALAGRGIEDRVGDVIRDGTGGADRLGVSLQGLDHMVQTLNELSHFLDDVALETEGHQRLAVVGPARRLRLRQLADALGARLPDPMAPSPRHEAGDVDLF